MCTFNDAATAYRLMPTLAGLARLTDAALPLLSAPTPRSMPTRWRKTTLPCALRHSWSNHADALAAPFTRLRVIVDRRLTDAEVERVAGCVGYALKETLRGDMLLVTNVMASYDAQQTVLICEYDSQASQRTCPDFAYALSLAAQYVQEGTPVRVSNRAGCGTMGTRLVDGIGGCEVEFAVR